MPNSSIIACRNVSKLYSDATAAVQVLSGVNLEIMPGERIAIIGPSGAGKSTLLHLLGGLDTPTEGTVTVQDKNWQTLSETARCRLRNQTLGFVYQFHYLLPEFTALENVAMSLLLAKQPIQTAQKSAERMLERVGLGHRKDHKPSQLSGGERQRVAIARALVHNPRCVLADEPTGNLDPQTAARIFELMLELNQQFQTALVVVTHDSKISSCMDRVLSVEQGKLIPS